ncbi:MAG: DUF1257 domain-containing protein [Nitrospirota bacterium]
MSHVAIIDIEIKDLEALKMACRDLGLEFVADQRTYRWYGRSVGDYPPPEGFTVQDLGKCEHAIRVPGNAQAYEIGVAKRRDGRPGWTLLWDFWNGGYGLQEKVGEKAVRLTQAYSGHAAIRAAQRLGFHCLGRTTAADGTVEIRLRAGGGFGWQK